MADPVASKSAFLCLYMSHHLDTLGLYVRYFGQVKGAITTAKMTSIDSKGMTLAYKTDGQGDAKQEVRVPFIPPLLRYEEVEPRLLRMKMVAEEALGVSKTPQITTFHLPSTVWQTTLVVASLAYVTLSPLPSSPFWHSVFAPALWVRQSVSPGFITASVYFTLFMHTSQALYTTLLVRRHKVPFIPAAKWVFSNLMWGYPILLELHHRIKEARIESIMRGQ